MWTFAARAPSSWARNLLRNLQLKLYLRRVYLNWSPALFQPVSPPTCFRIGATGEGAGYDKRTCSRTIHRMRRAAIKLVPALAEAHILEDWAGLRPGTPDHLPILGRTRTPGYFVATGHFRDGILLTPVTAQIMAQVVCRETPWYDLTAFSPHRFG